MQIFRHFAIAACAWVSLAGLAHAASPSESASPGAPAAQTPPPASVNWGQAHGMTSAQDGFNNLETKISTINAASLTRKWRAIAGVKLVSTPVVANGHVYAIGQDASLNYNLYGLDANTGTALPHFPRVNVSGVSPSVPLSRPVVDGNIVYVATRNGSSSQLFAFNATSGGKVPGFPVDLDHSAIPPATTNGGNVYQPAGYKIFGFDATTGAALSNYPITAPNKFISAAASVASVTISGTSVNELCVGSSDNYLYCFDAATGDQLFKVKTSGFFDVGGPAVSGGVIYFISWGEHKLHAIDAATGAEKWPSPLALTFASDSTPAIANGQVVIGDHGGNLYSVNATNGKIKWKKHLDSALDGSAVIANGVVYVNSAAKLYALDAATGARLWSTPNAGTFGLTPVVVNGAVFATSSTGGLSAFTP